MRAVWRRYKERLLTVGMALVVVAIFVVMIWAKLREGTPLW